MAQKLGHPCWQKENVSLAIATIAQLDSAMVHYFLACHSPMDNLIDVNSNDRVISEEELFQKIMRKDSRDICCVVRGEPGTGKSHLIHWLYQRLVFEEVEEFVPVLIRRRSGSLKDALIQIIEQLGEDFSEQLKPVTHAKEKISEGVAKEDLLLRICLELGSERRKDLKKSAIRKELRGLSNACRQVGFGNWLKRGDGVIDKNIKLLLESSEVEEREAAALFSEKELRVKAEYKRAAQNIPEVLDLLEEIEDSEALMKEAVDFLNDALRGAIMEMMDLSGSKIRDIFDKIRKDLKKQSKNLVLFIEDVSVMAALDKEVFNAVEPQNRSDLGKMIAVIGMTEGGWAQIEKNMKDRATDCILAGGAVTEEWINNEDKLAEFTARYLNAIRLDEKDVRKIAKNRRSGDDVNISKCDKCAVKDECHSIFGQVIIGNKSIGMFPFSRHAPKEILGRLNESQSVRRNQRGFLNQILSPIIDNQYDYLEQNIFPDFSKIQVKEKTIIFWSIFLENYCGGWTVKDKKRIAAIAQGWLPETENKEQLAAFLKKFLKPFEFGEFSRETENLTPVSIPDSKEDNEQEKIRTDEVVKKLKPKLGQINNWVNGEVLRSDQYFRELMSSFVRNCISWVDSDCQAVQWKELQGYKFVSIEGQISSVRDGSLTVEFKRNEDTKKLLEALVQHDINKSWDFEDGEKYKRDIFEYVLRFENFIIKQVSDIRDKGIEFPVENAIKFLALAAIAGKHPEILKEDVGKAYKIFDGKWDYDKKPEFFSGALNSIVEDIDVHYERVLEFCKNELYVPQGMQVGEVNFINPGFLIKLFEHCKKNLSIENLPSGYVSGYLKSRYLAIAEITGYDNVIEILSREKDEVNSNLKEIEELLNIRGVHGDNISEAIIKYFKEFEELVKIADENQLLPYDRNFQAFKDAGNFSKAQASKNGSIFECIRGLLKEKHEAVILTAPISGLIKARQIFDIAETVILKIEGGLNQREQAGGDQEKNKENWNQINMALEDIGNIKI